MSFVLDIDVNTTNVTEAFFEETCLKQNIPVIFRNCDNNNNKSSGLETDSLCRALAALEVSATTKYCETTTTKIEKELELLKSYSLKNNINISELQVEVEVEPRQPYQKISLKEFFEKNSEIFTSLLETKEKNENSSSSSSSSKNFYLKDWHFQEFFEKVVVGKEQNESSSSSSFSSSLYKLPQFMRKFASDDILQKYQRFLRTTKKEEDSSSCCFGATPREYKFVYAGSSNTKTIPHFDVCATYSWSLNLSGQKVWRFPISNEVNENLLKEYFGFDNDNNNKNTEKKNNKVLETMMVEEKVDEQNSSSCRCSEKLKFVEIIQNPGDIIFVPALIIHEVFNMSSSSSCSPHTNFCVSVNHNWYVGAYSIKHIVRLLTHEAIHMYSDLDSETIEIFKNSSSSENNNNNDNDGKNGNHNDFEKIFNLMLKGSSAWNFEVVKNLLNFCLMMENDDNDDEQLFQEEVKKGLAEIEKVEKSILF